MKRTCSLVLVFLVALTSLAFAQTDTVFATYKYVMGDNDTKSDARNLCFLNAKKLCLEKAGTFVQEQLSLKKRQVQGSGKTEYSEVFNQDIQSFTGAFLKIEVVSEEVSSVGGAIAITMTVKALVNSESILDQISAVKEDQGLAKRLKDQQDQLAAMEAKIGQLQAQLKTSSPDLTKPARVERIEVFAKMSELEAIKYDIAHKSKIAADYIELGMTPEEVIILLGQPRSKTAGYGIRPVQNKNLNSGRRNSV